MASWVINVHVRWLSKVHSRIKAELLSHDLMHADETTVQVLKEPSRKPTRKSRMWLFCSAKRDTPAYVYEYHETPRAGRVAEGFLRRWQGHAHHRRLPPLLQPPGGRRHQHRVPGARPPKVRRDRQGRRRRRQGGQVPVPQRRARRAQDDRRDVQGRQGLRQARREGAQGEEDRGAPAPHAQLYAFCVRSAGGRDAEEQAGQWPCATPSGAGPTS